MRVIEGIINSGRTRYVISEYIVPKLKNGGKVYYYGRKDTVEIIEDITEYTGDNRLADKGKLVGISDIESYEVLDKKKTAMLVIDDYYVYEEDIDYLKELSKDREVIVITQLSNGDEGIIIDNGREINYNKETLEIV